MKYYHETKILTVSDCIGGFFVATIKDPEPEVKPYGYYVTHKDYLMDSLGRISDVGFDSIETDRIFGKRKKDGAFIARNGKVKFLIDGNSKIIAEDIVSASDFAENGYACVEFKDRNYWVDRNGNKFGDEFSNVGWFDHGYAPVKLKNGKSTFVNSDFEPVGKEFDNAFVLFSEKFYGAKIGDNYYVLDRNFDAISAPLDDIFVVTDYGYIIKHQKKGSFFGLEIVDMTGKKYASGNIINGYDSKLLRIQDNGYRFFNQETGKIIGGEKGYVYAEEFNGDFTAAIIGYDDNDDGIYTFIREDGSMFPETYEMTFMVKSNVGAFYVPNKAGTGGKFFLIDKDGNQIGKTGYKNLHSFDSNGLATFRKVKNTWSAIDESFKIVDLNLENLSNFVDGFATATVNGKKREIVDKYAVNMTQISEIAKKIQLDPSAFLSLPEEILEDKPLIRRLYNLAKSEVLARTMDEPRSSQSLNYTLRALDSAFESAMLYSRDAKHKK